MTWGKLEKYKVHRFIFVFVKRVIQVLILIFYFRFNGRGLKVLVFYYSKGGNTKKFPQDLFKDVNSVEGVHGY